MSPESVDNRIAELEADVKALRAEIDHFKEMFDKGVKSLLSNQMARMALKQFGVDPESFNADNLRH